jgi:pimeloyl-ACP methyl ester carboxylesterase
MSSAMTGLFVPGWGGATGLYLAGLPEGWEPLELPAFRTTRGELAAYRRWLGAEIAHRPTPVALAGHSMGGALALLAALDQPELVRKLILVSPAGLPLKKPMWASMATFIAQVVRGCYPVRELLPAVARVAAAPRAALRLAQSVHDLDLTAELELIRSCRIPCTVVGCVSDQLTTSEHCRRLATLLNASYRELDAAEGHIWMITEPQRLTEELTR